MVELHSVFTTLGVYDENIKVWRRISINSITEGSKSKFNGLSKFEAGTKPRCMYHCGYITYILMEVVSI